MKALLFADFCTIRKSIGQYLFSVVLICGIVTFTSFNGGLDPEGAAGVVQGNIMSIAPLMFAFYAFFSLFGQDEREGWESVRLSMPFTRWQIVASRYAMMLIIIAVLLAVFGLLAAVITAIVTMVRFGAVTLMPAEAVAAAIVLCLAVSLIYLAIEIPIFFKMGFMKARLYFTLPFFACMLFMLEPVQKLAETVAGKMLELVAFMGSPVPLVVGAIALAFALYALSSRISLNVYRTREF